MHPRSDSRIDAWGHSIEDLATIRVAKQQRAHAIVPIENSYVHAIAPALGVDLPIISQR